MWQAALEAVETNDGRGDLGHLDTSHHGRKLLQVEVVVVAPKIPCTVCGASGKATYMGGGSPSERVC